MLCPDAELDSAFWALVTDFERAGDFRLQREAALARGGFAQLLRYYAEEEAGIGLPEGIVPQATYWLVRAGACIVGISVLRLRMTPALEDVGGHIGCVIAPSQRRKGYGTTLLARTLLIAQGHGFPRVLLPCDTVNAASARIIESNGGTLASQDYAARRGGEVSRYWIALSHGIERESCVQGKVHDNPHGDDRKGE